jgi:acyl-CoA thioesterase-2
MTDAANELLELIDLEALEVNLFRGESRDVGTSRVFGGQVLCQAVLAASRTVDNRMIHSLHGYFLRAGDHMAPIVYDVDRSRDGGSYSARRVVAIQHGQPIFTLSASFHTEEKGLEHQFPAPDVPGPDHIESSEPISPEELAQVPPILRRWFDRFGPFEFRPVRLDDPFNSKPKPPFREVWFRMDSGAGEDQMLHRALLAYVSDFHLVGTATLPHGISWLQGGLMMASIDHAMWFHRDCRVDDWLLYACDSPSSSGGRGLARGMIYDQDGRLVASTAQEGVMRVPRKEPV